MDEGLASYYQGLEIDEGRAWLGRSAYRFGIRVRSDIPTLSWLLGSDAKTFYVRNDGADRRNDVDARYERVCHYAGARALVQLLKNGGGGYPQRWNDYLFALVEGKTAQEAWQRAYGNIPVERLENDYASVL